MGDPLAWLDCSRNLREPRHRPKQATEAHNTPRPPTLIRSDQISGSSGWGSSTASVSPQVVAALSLSLTKTESVLRVAATGHDKRLFLKVVSYLYVISVIGRAMSGVTVAYIEDGRLMADAEMGEFWGFFGGFAPLPKKTTTDETKSTDSVPLKLFCVEKGETAPIEVDSWTRDLLDTHKCYILDCGMEVFIWMGRNTSLNQKKAASSAVDELLHSQDGSKSHVIRVIEGFETVIFCSKFDSWPQTTNVTVSEEGRGKVAGP